MEPQDTRFRSKNAHKNTGVFIGDNIKEPFVFQYSFYCIFPRKKQQIRQRRRQENHRCGSWEGGDHIYIYMYIRGATLPDAISGQPRPPSSLGPDSAPVLLELPDTSGAGRPEHPKKFRLTTPSFLQLLTLHEGSCACSGLRVCHFADFVRASEKEKVPYVPCQRLRFASILCRAACHGSSWNVSSGEEGGRIFGRMIRQLLADEGNLPR